MQDKSGKEIKIMNVTKKKGNNMLNAFKNKSKGKTWIYFFQNLELVEFYKF